MARIRKPTSEMNPVETHPDVFIIESLDVNEENANQFLGRVIEQALFLSGLRPAYHYVRSKEEFRAAIELFHVSHYRNLHLSMHARNDLVALTEDILPNEEFAEILDGKLKNRRLFFSACCVGAGNLPSLIARRNHGGYSILSPIETLPFSVSCSLFPALYVSLLRNNASGFGSQELSVVLKPLAQLFKTPLQLIYYKPDKDQWAEKQFSP